MEKYFLSMAIFENSLLTEYVFVEWWFDDYDYHSYHDDIKNIRIFSMIMTMMIMDSG